MKNVINNSNALLNSKYFGYLSWFVLLMLFPFVTYAVQTGDSTVITISGKLQGVTNCKISNNALIEVGFGKVNINKVDSGQYIEKLAYTLDCGNTTASNTVTMTFKSPLSAPLSSSIPTSVNGLVVDVLKDGVLMPLNTGILIDPKVPPMVQLRLNKILGATLIEEPFTATGTIMVEYI